MMRFTAGLAGITLAQAARVKTDARDVSLNLVPDVTAAAVPAAAVPAAAVTQCTPVGSDEYSSTNKLACTCNGDICTTDKYCYKKSSGAVKTCESRSASPDQWLNAKALKWCEKNDATKLTEKCACDRTSISTPCDPITPGSTTEYCFSPFGSSSSQCQQYPKCPQDATGKSKITAECACESTAPCLVDQFCAYDDQAKTAKCNTAPTCSKSDTKAISAGADCMCGAGADSCAANSYCFDVAGKPTCSVTPRKKDCKCTNGEAQKMSNQDNTVGCPTEAASATGTEAASATGTTAVNTEKCTKCNSGYTLKTGKCEKNTCTCVNGTGATGEKCPIDGAQNCEVCPDGFKLTPDRDENNPNIGSACYPNQCRCENGLATAGTACKEHNSQSCVSCGNDYLLTKVGDKSVCKAKTGKKGGSECKTVDGSDCQSGVCDGYTASVAATAGVTGSQGVAEKLGSCQNVCKCRNGTPTVKCATDGEVSCTLTTTPATGTGTCENGAGVNGTTCTTWKTEIECVGECAWKGAATQTTTSGGCNPGFGPEGKCDKENICKCTDGADEIGVPMKGVMSSGGYCKTIDTEQCLKCKKSKPRYHFVKGSLGAAVGDFGTCVQNTCVCIGRSDRKTNASSKVGLPSTGADCDKFEKPAAGDTTGLATGVAQMCADCSIDSDYVFNKNQKSCTDGCAETGGACAMTVGGVTVDGTVENGVMTGANLWQAKNGKCCGSDRTSAVDPGIACVANGMKDADGNYQHIIYDVNEKKQGRHLFGSDLKSCMTSEEKILSDASYVKFQKSQKGNGEKCDNGFDCTSGKCEMQDSEKDSEKIKKCVAGQGVPTNGAGGGQGVPTNGVVAQTTTVATTTVAPTTTVATTTVAPTTTVATTTVAPTTE